MAAAPCTKWFLCFGCMRENSQASGLLPFSVRSRIALLAVALVVTGFAVVVLKLALAQYLVLLVLVLGTVAVAGWVLLAREKWWMVVPVGCSFGGLFYFGFRIYTHEMALVLAVLALLPYIAMAQPGPVVRRAIPGALYILLVYLALHLTVSEVLCRQEGRGGAGNILRVYMYGLWPLVFAVLFSRFGSARNVRYVLLAMYVASLCRVLLGFTAYYSPKVMFYLPGINYIPSGALNAGMDLRASTLMLVSLSLCYASLSRSRLASIFHTLMLIPSLWLILLGGGRVSVAMFFGIVVFWALLQRKLAVLMGLAAGLMLFVTVVSNDPTVISRFPARMQRTMGIFVVGPHRNEIQRPVMSSNMWHEDLADLGRKNWLKSPVSFLLGNRVHRFDEALYRPWTSVGYRELIVSRQGYYEAGLWTILGVTGGIGALLYVMILGTVLKRCLFPLVKERLRDHATAFCFLASASSLMWLCFCWIYGHFPSQEIMMALIAAAAYDESRRDKATAAPQSHPV